MPLVGFKGDDADDDDASFAVGSEAEKLWVDLGRPVEWQKREESL